MHVNNETGVRQPVQDVADGLRDRAVFCMWMLRRVSAKTSTPCVIRGSTWSASAVIRSSDRRDGGACCSPSSREDDPLAPLMFGGARSSAATGNLAVALLSGFGLAAELACEEHEERQAACCRLRQTILEGLMSLNPVYHGT